MQFKNLDELITTKEEIKFEVMSYEKALEDAKNEKKKANRYNKSYWNPIIENYKSIIESKNDKIIEINTIIDGISTYPKELLMPFIMECINLHEDERYVHRNVLVSTTSHLTNADFFPTYMHYEMIFPETLLEEETKIENMFYVSVLFMAYKELFETSESKYTMMPAQGYLKIVTQELTLLSYFEHFPYLEEIGMNLIERKIKEPDKKIVDILNDELDSLKEEQKRKLKN